MAATTRAREPPLPWKLVTAAVRRRIWDPCPRIRPFRASSTRWRRPSSSSSRQAPPARLSPLPRLDRGRGPDPPPSHQRRCPPPAGAGAAPPGLLRAPSLPRTMPAPTPCSSVPSASSRFGSRGSAPTPPPHIAMAAVDLAHPRTHPAAWDLAGRTVVDPCFVYAAGPRPGGHHIDVRIIATVCLDPLRRTTPLPRRRSSRLRHPLAPLSPLPALCEPPTSFPLPLSSGSPTS